MLAVLITAKVAVRSLVFNQERVCWLPLEEVAVVGVLLDLVHLEPIHDCLIRELLMNCTLDWFLNNQGLLVFEGRPVVGACKRLLFHSLAGCFLLAKSRDALVPSVVNFVDTLLGRSLDSLLLLG